jgi:hypothetical protein
MPPVPYSRAHYQVDGSYVAWSEGTLGYGMTDDEIATKFREINDERAVSTAKYEATRKARREAISAWFLASVGLVLARSAKRCRMMSFGLFITY